MYRYIATFWNCDDVQAESAAKAAIAHLRSSSTVWKLAFEDKGVCVLQTGERSARWQAYVLPSQDGVVLGKLFKKGSQERDKKDNIIDKNDASKIVATGGRHLIDEYWGRYVAILRNGLSGAYCVLRDPGGALQCTRYRGSKIEIYFSRLEDVIGLPMVRLGINWRYIAAHLWSDSIQIADTGFEECDELLPGECVVVGGMVNKRHFLWKPAEISGTDIVEDPREAEEKLRRATIECVQSWASCYSRILHNLSGGLDSAIVLACLIGMSARPQVSGLNIRVDVPGSDERHFARMAANRAGIKLFEKEWPPSCFRTERILDFSLHVKPHRATLLPEFHLGMAQLSREIAVDAFFSGQGGDQIYCQAKSPLIAADYAFHHPFSKNLWNVAYLVAQLTRKSVWSVLNSATRFGLMRQAVPPRLPLTQENTILTRSSFDLLSREYISHPWLLDVEGIPPAQAYRIFSIVNCYSLYERTGRCEAVDVVDPLISQPLLESCLQIPSYVLALNGRERGLIRHAFKEEVPTEILQRRSKGQTTGLMNLIMRNNMEFIRDFLLNGILVKEGMIEAKRAEGILFSDEAILGPECQMVYESVGVEAWLRNATRQQHRAAA